MTRFSHKRIESIQVAASNSYAFYSRSAPVDG
jgi:hypothetical protein